MLVRTLTQLQHARGFNLWHGGQGYAIGNGVTDEQFDGDATIPFAFFKSLISARQFAALARACNSSYWDPPAGSACARLLDDAGAELARLNLYDILLPCFPTLQEGLARLDAGAHAAWPLRAARAGRMRTWHDLLGPGLGDTPPCLDHRRAPRGAQPVRWAPPCGAPEPFQTVPACSHGAGDHPQQRDGPGGELGSAVHVMRPTTDTQMLFLDVPVGSATHLLHAFACTQRAQCVAGPAGGAARAACSAGGSHRSLPGVHQQARLHARPTIHARQPPLSAQQGHAAPHSALSAFASHMLGVGGVCALAVHMRSRGRGWCGMQSAVRATQQVVHGKAVDGRHAQGCAC